LRLAKQFQFLPVQNVVYFITLHFWFVKYSHFTKMMCYYLNVHFQGQRVKQNCAPSWIYLRESRFYLLNQSSNLFHMFPNHSHIIPASATFHLLVREANPFFEIALLRCPHTDSFIMDILHEDQHGRRPSHIQEPRKCCT